METQGEHQHYWLARAKRLQIYVNAVNWFESFLPSILGLNVVVGCLILFLRGQDVDVMSLLWFFGIVLGMTGLVVAFCVRSRSLPIFAALLRIETAMHFDNRLTTAYEGLIEWPAPDQPPKALYELKWKRPVGACILSFLFFVASLIFPIGFEKTSPLAENPSPPRALVEVESWIDQIDEEAFVDEVIIDELRSVVEGLKSRPSEEWFDPSALEAADNLQAQMGNALSGLAHNLKMTSAILEGAQQIPAGLRASYERQLEEPYREAISNLGEGPLPLSSDLMEQLEGVDFSQPSSINSEQFEQLKARSEQLAQFVQSMANMSPEEAERLQEYYESLCEVSGERRLKQQMAPGGIQRGRDDAKMSYSNYRSPESVALTEGVSNQDLSGAVISDKIQTSISREEVKVEVFSGPGQGGQIESLGQGGDAVWIDRLTPDERSVLKQYFK